MSSKDGPKQVSEDASTTDPVLKEVFALRQEVRSRHRKEQLQIAVLSVLAALLGAVLGGVASYKASQLQVTATQAQDLRQARRDAYRAFLSPALAFQRACEYDARRTDGSILARAEGDVFRASIELDLIASPTVDKAARAAVNDMIVAIGNAADEKKLTVSCGLVITDIATFSARANEELTA